MADFDLKKLKNIALPAVLSICILVEMFVYFSKLKEYQEAKQVVENSLANLKIYARKPELAPSEEKLNSLIEYHKQFQTLQKQILYTFKSVAHHDLPLKALEFKEKLRTLESEYSKYRIPIQNGLGFKEFYGANLPSDEQLIVLTKQLAIVTKMIQTLIDNNVEEIIEIKRLSTYPVKSTIANKVLFINYPIRLTFKIFHESFLEFINIINSDPSLYKIGNFKIESNFEEKDPNSLRSRLLTVSILLQLTEYEES